MRLLMLVFNLTFFFFFFCAVPLTAFATEKKAEFHRRTCRCMIHQAARHAIFPYLNSGKSLCIPVLCLSTKRTMGGFKGYIEAGLMKAFAKVRGKRDKGYKDGAFCPVLQMSSTPRGEGRKR